ncbi:precorrin-6y C5,15-methyltransferase (decarboxylating) subunit CbiE [Corynebacterium sp. P6145]|uniref:precorrin-6y C5,15-methyltransferase (decarboxylating) subunit CbiE n=1 Tax=Corynebacterium antarcticum TaxID=2800405 RepID=UPI002005350E|nr:precorrin-6y C5,15-methyltransferase (decarboxylating) subunit CbiE [Corynebacterium antarcticum]MCK7641380.1 precorrin-6y C5,15-methyltransferase (decarboxylating) subunit CbiE [Corynebacterium antarcticum]MCX7490981.1 precorrin-6y C5,15-methyltransferase (decarboxylating) subunit CbiE [Corynebacterium antarcticum]
MSNSATGDRAATDSGVSHPEAFLASVVGISAAGMGDLPATSLDRLRAADVVIGSWRQLNLIDGEITAERRPWPSPLLPSIEPLFKEFSGRRIVVLGSGDPMFHGIGTTLTRIFGPGNIEVLPLASSVSLACAHLGWPLNDTPVVSLVTRPVSAVIPLLDQGRRFLILGRDETTPGEVSSLLAARGHGGAKVHVLSDLGGPDAHTQSYRAAAAQPPRSALNVIAVIPAGTHGRSLLPGLPDDSYDTDEGQLTKADVRAWTVCALAPRPGERLWDIGGGAGSVAIEWLRSTPGTSAVSFERAEHRRRTMTDNARNLGVEHLEVLGDAPGSFGKADTDPDVIFIGGGLTALGLAEAAWSRLKSGGRLVANAVTVESERELWQLRDRFGGRITRIQIDSETSIGGFTALRPALPVTQWRATKQGPEPTEQGENHTP